MRHAPDTESHVQANSPTGKAEGLCLLNRNKDRQPGIAGDVVMVPHRVAGYAGVRRNAVYGCVPNRSAAGSDDRACVRGLDSHDGSASEDSCRRKDSGRVDKVGLVEP